ncbi:hypothetical protein EVAR_62796_1 [Eumeta japonica]|uniref:Uncharacterized protein n=1 Tax=Eumeta variegata TaxID=151549 RepID=A0A4C1ZHR0_EUMVA|nr:hypothetical protein EVAR_62796_1 [Eumeta japonica]
MKIELDNRVKNETKIRIDSGIGTKNESGTGVENEGRDEMRTKILAQYHKYGIKARRTSNKRRNIRKYYVHDEEATHSNEPQRLPPAHKIEEHELIPFSYFIDLIISYKSMNTGYTHERARLIVAFRLSRACERERETSDLSSTPSADASE